MKTRVMGLAFLLSLIFHFSLFGKSVETIIKSNGVSLYGNYNLEVGIADFDARILTLDHLITFSGFWNLRNKDGIYFRQAISRDLISQIYKNGDEIIIEFNLDGYDISPISRITIDKRSKRLTVIPHIKKEDFELDDTFFDLRHHFHQFQNNDFLRVDHAERLPNNLLLRVSLSIFGSKLLTRFSNVKIKSVKNISVPFFLETIFHVPESAPMPKLDSAHELIVLKALAVDGLNSFAMGQLTFNKNDIKRIYFEERDGDREPLIALEFKKSTLKKFRPIESLKFDIEAWNSVQVKMRPAILDQMAASTTRVLERNCYFSLTQISHHQIEDALGH